VCETCAVAAQALGTLTPVVPIALYTKPSPLRDVLTYYKPGREVFEPRFRALLGDLIRRFFTAHGSNLEHHLGGWTDIVVVPSTYRTGEHPLREVLQTVGVINRSGLVQGVGLPGRHRTYEPDLFRVDSVRASRRRVLLIEDVYVTGARSQSCATALRSAGADVAGIVAVGRRVNPNHDELSAQHWSRHAELSPSLDRSHAWLRSGE